MQKRVWLVLFTLMLTTLLAACGGTDTGSNPSSSNTPTGDNASTPTSTSTSACAPVDASSTAYTMTDKSSATYDVQEQFLNRDLPNTAHGKTDSVQGGFLVSKSEPATISAMKVTVDLSKLQSDEDRRDNAIRDRWLESNTYPNAVFVTTGPTQLPADASSGKEVTFEISGNMTIHNTTHPETFKVTGKLTGDTVTGKATSLVYMKNYGFDAPSIAGLLTVKDGVTVTLDFTAQKGNCSPVS